MALDAEISADEAARHLVAMAGATAAAPIALARALTQLRSANALRPSRLTAAAVEALGLAHARLVSIAALGRTR